MKKIIILFLIFLMGLFIFSLIAGTTLDEDIEDTAKNAVVIAVGIRDVGFSTWVKSNWWMGILSLVGLGHLVTRITPTKKDDTWYGKYILKPVRFIGKFISFGFTGKKKII